MGKIYLVRHGQSEDNATGIFGGRRDSDLTEQGIAQAKKAAEKLLEESIDAIYSSPLKRAFKTARIIADRLEIKDILTDDRLIERDYGVLSGKPYADAYEYAQGITHTDTGSYFLEAKGAEDFQSLLRRGAEAINEIKKKHPDDNIVIMTHCDIVRMIRAAYYGWTWEEGLGAPDFGNADVFELTESQPLRSHKEAI